MKAKTTQKTAFVTQKTKEDFKTRVLAFANTIQKGVSKEYMSELKKHQDEADFIEKNL